MGATQFFDFDELEDPFQERDDGEVLIEADEAGVPRGKCLGCGRCRCWMNGPGSREFCHGCECPSSEHQDLQAWFSRVRVGLDMTLGQMLLVGLPLAAMAWDPLEVQLFVGSRGTFNPKRDCLRGPERKEVDPEAEKEQRRAVKKEGGEEEVLISVICPTTSSRHRFHSMLYESFRRQTYEPRELVVVDTGEGPSKVLADVAAKDPSVVYHYFREPAVGISLGVKRNIACYLARGKVIVQFDDDDLYAPGYLELMLGGLEEASKQPQAVVWEEIDGAVREADEPKQGMDLPLATTLRSWHTFDPVERSFTFVDVKTEKKINKAEKDDWIYGWGFSFAFTREAWLRCPFSNITFAEDSAFMQALRSLPAVVTTLSGKDGLCAHTYHPKVSTSNGENQGGERCGQEVPPPEPILDLLPKLLAAEGQLDVPRSEGGSRYFVLGSWSDWKTFEELQRESGSKVYQLAVPILDPPKRVEFQIFVDRDYNKCFYPHPRRPSTILGPWRKHGANWSADVPRSGYSLTISWDPRGDRSLTWTTGSSLSIRFHVVGSWSNWQSFEEMELVGRGPVFSLRVAFEGDGCAFQIAQDGSWEKRYWPSVSSGFTSKPSEVSGPGDPPKNGLNWNVRRPAGCEDSLLLLRWEPIGRRATWVFSPPPMAGKVQTTNTFVVLRGLQEKPHYNGEVGLTEEWNQAQGHWVVRLASGELPRVRPEHLRLFREVALAPGAVVRLRGLKDRSELNGLVATCRAWIPETDSWRLKLWPGQAAAGSADAKAENLEFAGK